MNMDMDMNTDMKTKMKKAGGALVVVSQRGKSCIVRRADGEGARKDKDGKGKGKGKGREEEGDRDVEMGRVMEMASIVLMMT